MYERSFFRNLECCEGISGGTLFCDCIFFCFDFDLVDCFFLILSLINPVVDCDSSFCVFFYLIGDLKTWQLVFSQYIMKGRSADTKLFCYSTLFLIIYFHPFCEFIHIITFFYIFLWKKIRKFDTISNIPEKLV